ncbi:hypothetical protein BpHYR1_051963 [Brachionus plicatilis]|uniref:Uncharacterized protein n=1 Tax=Brachionus plicatilis TaxID=10195 RepID=A0A3M7QSA1_BRAPC|nr:hypothetical protein BpHYR1_051963 [Brachionus plicatilis]
MKISLLKFSFIPGFGFIPFLIKVLSNLSDLNYLKRHFKKYHSTFLFFFGTQILRHLFKFLKN